MLSALYRDLKTTLLGGTLVVLPLVGCAYLIGLTFTIVCKILAPLNKLLPIESVAGTAVVDAAAVLLVLLVCFLLGLLVRTAGGRALGRWFEATLLNQLPGYELFRRLSRQVAGQTEEALGAPVLVRLGDSRQFGFLIEEHPSGDATVFIPWSPVLYLGAIHLVPAEAVARLSHPLPQVLDSLSRFGIGSSALIPPQRAPRS